MGFFNKDITTMEDMFVHGLQDIYYAEKKITTALPKMIENATNRDLSAGLRSHLEETEKQVERLEQVFKKLGKTPPAHWNLAQLQFGVFEELVEHHLWEPTFIVDHPVEVSPLARAADADPTRTERFELYMTGREIANGFSELNDAEDQAARFHAQVANKDAGDEEADGLVHLRRREPDPFVLDHRVDHVVDELLEGRRPDGGRIDLPRDLAEHGMSHARDLQNRHDRCCPPCLRVPALRRP